MVISQLFLLEIESHILESKINVADAIWLRTFNILVDDIGNIDAQKLPQSTE